MVSLVNFKSVSELAAERDSQNVLSDTRLTGGRPESKEGHLLSLAGGESVPRARTKERQQEEHQGCRQQMLRKPKNSNKKYHLNKSSSGASGGPEELNIAKEEFQGGGGGEARKEHFEIRWQNLTYQVEPKWYARRWNALTGAADGSGRRPSAGELDAEGQTGAASRRGSKTTVILSELNGSVKSGQVTAILGPSGAGKTSLLGCLTGKKKSGVSGCVSIISNRSDRMSVCTIPQKDYLLNQLTVRENLWFASRLKHPEENFDHDSNIERVLELLKLESCIDTKISKISGGQYKRVSIAQELLSNPDILILDEPTSGLDSLTCYKTVLVLRDLAQRSPQPMAIIVTIHQPQREVFELFNHIYILAVGGRCIYEGRPSQSIKTINSYGAGLQFDANQYNPASYLVEIASVEFGQKPIEALVEHQRREFKRRTLLEDSGNLLSLSANAAGTPNLKKRQSPMVARFKSTFNSLAGSAKSPSQPVASAQSKQASAMAEEATITTKQPAFAYANEAFENSAAPDEPDQTNNNNIEEPRKAAGSECGSASGHSMGSLDEGAFYLDDRLQTHKHDHSGHFFRHCSLLTKRSWLCLCKDPMLTTLRFSAHIIVPLLITLVYGSRVGKPNACPLYETEMDLIEYARNGAKRLLNLQDELRCSFENVGLYFLSIYAFTFSTMCLTSLSFPLNMHVLLKEVRNGWYSIPTYFIGKTLADFPLEFILPTLTLMITYPLTGQPSSHYEWRFILATLIFVVTSLIAQTQGLIFGALFMNAMQAAVFVAPVSTTPLILLSGFLIRISQMPIYLQKLSTLSYFRYAIESLTIIRYGFGQCPCDPQVVTGLPVSSAGVPDQLRTMTNYWLSTFDSSNGRANDSILLENSLNDSLLATTTLEPTSVELPAEQPVDFFQDLTVLLARANSFGTEIKTCDDLKPYPMIDFSLQENQLYVWVAALVATLFFSKLINYLVVKYSVKLRL